MLGDTYTVVDMAAWGWARAVASVLGEESAARLAHLNRLIEEINARPVAARVAALKGRHPFKSEIDEQGRSFLFRHNPSRTS
jgi:GST-like protein